MEAALGLVDVAVPDPPTAPPPAATVTPLVAEVKVTPVAVASKPEISEPLAEPEAVSMCVCVSPEAVPGAGKVERQSRANRMKAGMVDGAGARRREGWNSRGERYERATGDSHPTPHKMTGGKRLPS